MTDTSAKTAPNILVVDDTLENLRLLANLLGGRGYEIRPVTNGRQALLAAQRDPPDLILLDINMPEMSGYETCARLKEMKETRDVPVIFLTALSETADKVRAFDAGGVDYVTKPFQFEEVLARVRTHVALRTAQRELNDGYQRLRALEELRDKLVHMIVHDMRSPLMALTMNLEFFQGSVRSHVSAEANEDLDGAIRGAKMLARIANDLLDVSRLEEGRMPLRYAPTDVAQLIHETIDRLRGMDRDRQFDVTTDGDTVISCDADVVRRVIENLTSNALKHTPSGGRVQFGVVRANGRARVTITDEGPGVPVDAREKIFEKFGTVEARESSKHHSVGLGLAFCKLAVSAHHGSIGVESAMPYGSVFWFELPFNESQST